MELQHHSKNTGTESLESTELRFSSTILNEAQERFDLLDAFSAAKAIVNKVFSASVLSKERLRDNVDARKSLCMIMRNYGASYSDIGRFLKKNHATVIHLCKSGDGLLESDRDFLQKHSLASGFFNDTHGSPAVPSKASIKSKYSALIVNYNSVLLDNKRLMMDNAALRPDSIAYRRHPELFAMIAAAIKPGREEEMYQKIKRVLNGQ